MYVHYPTIVENRVIRRRQVFGTSADNRGPRLVIERIYYLYTITHTDGHPSMMYTLSDMMMLFYLHVDSSDVVTV